MKQLLRSKRRHCGAGVFMLCFKISLLKKASVTVWLVLQQLQASLAIKTPAQLLLAERSYLNITMLRVETSFTLA